MDTWRRFTRSIETQEVLPFTGEGAYHGSTKSRKVPPRKAKLVEEARLTTLEQYTEEGRTEIGEFEITIPNNMEIIDTLPVPSQEQVQKEGVTFCWCPFNVALREADPLVKQVLERMQPHLNRKKRFAYIDAKVQFFRAGDVPVDSILWHLDGTGASRDDRVQRFGHTILHDLKARLTGDVAPPTYLAYQSSNHCATQFVTSPLQVRLPEMAPNFDVMDSRVREMEPSVMNHPPGSIIRFDGLSLHRPVRATESGWRLWVRCVETDREVQLTSQIINCYGTVFR